MLSLFAADGPGVPLAAEPVFHVGPLAVTNSMLFGLVIAVFVVSLFAAAAKRTSLNPKSKFAFAIETVVEFLLNTAEETFGDRKKALKHLPLLVTLFTFILVSNLSGLIPGVGTVVAQTADGSVPLFRAFTTDLNATLALAILTITTVQFYAIKELGIVGHLKHYFTDKPYNPLNLFLGLIEVMGEFIRILTLSMRLFGVIYAGEVLIHAVGSLAGNFGWASMVPVYLMEVFFSAIQAYIFVMLTTVYLSIATTHAEGGVPEEDESDHSPADLKPVADVLNK
jgi:F-type H+-transporting ATPase subunit a